MSHPGPHLRLPLPGYPSAYPRPIAGPPESVLCVTRRGGYVEWVACRGFTYQTHQEAYIMAANEEKSPAEGRPVEGITGIVINGGFKHNGVHYPEVDPVTGNRTKLILPRAAAERLIRLGRFMPPDEALAEQPAVAPEAGKPESGGGKP